MEASARELLNALPESTMLVTRQGDIVAANTAAHELFERPNKDDLTTFNICALVVEPQHKVQSFLDRCARNGSSSLALFTFRREHGEPLAYRCEGARLSLQSPLILLRQRPRAEATTAFTALNERITNLNRSHHQLETEVRTRTTELLEAREALRRLSATLMQAQDQERRRIARELHDSAGQLLTAIQLNLQLIPETEMSTSAKRRIDETIELTDQAINEVRVVSYLLHPPLLDEEGLPIALQTFIDGFQQRSNIKTCFHAIGTLRRLEEEVETAIFRIVQEGLTNIHRHSGSKTAEVLLRMENTMLELVIRDYGRGMPDNRNNACAVNVKPGVGIQGMKERVRLLGGDIIFAAANPGTHVTVRLPHSRNNDARAESKLRIEQERSVDVV